MPVPTVTTYCVAGNNVVSAPKRQASSLVFNQRHSQPGSGTTLTSRSAPSRRISPNGTMLRSNWIVISRPGSTSLPAGEIRRISSESLVARGMGGPMSKNTATKNTHMKWPTTAQQYRLPCIAFPPPQIIDVFIEKEINFARQYNRKWLPSHQTFRWFAWYELPDSQYHMPATSTKSRR